ncbi:hypothetical protein CBF23_002690 [Marinomonas agarivorans]|nr:hypothetical protein CBF23_002690 [Marinomonas agarivorans]
MKTVFWSVSSVVLLVALLLVVLVLAPLRYWPPFVNTLLSNQSIRVATLQGQLWNGQADFTVKGLTGNMTFSWELVGLLAPIPFALQHEQLNGVGTLSLNYQDMMLHLNKLRFNSLIANDALLPYSVQINNSQVIAENVFVHWFYDSKLPRKTQGKGYWSGGMVRYPVGRHQRMVVMKGMQFELTTVNQEPHFQLVSEQIAPEQAASEQGTDLPTLYLHARVKQDGEAEATIMPALLNALGQFWSGDSNVPAFVMTQQIFE